MSVKCSLLAVTCSFSFMFFTLPVCSSSVEMTLIYYLFSLKSTPKTLSGYPSYNNNNKTSHIVSALLLIPQIHMIRFRAAYYSTALKDILETEKHIVQWSRKMLALFIILTFQQPALECFCNDPTGTDLTMSFNLCTLWFPFHQSNIDPKTKKNFSFSTTCSFRSLITGMTYCQMS